jgi:hypothetical protein
MNINDNVILTELEFSKIIAHYKSMKYGKLFYNETNKCSHDSSHGYSRELISHIIRYHKEQIDADFYLWVENPSAQKIYVEAGFTLMLNQYEAWSAIYNIAKDE